MRTTESIELEAYRDLFAAAPAALPAETAEAEGALAIRFSPAAAVIEVNRIMGLTSVEPLGELVPLYGGELFAISLDPETGLGPELEARGFRAGYPWQKFVRGTDPFEATSELEVTEARAGEDFGRAFAAGYGLPTPIGVWMAQLVGRPDWHCFVAYDGAAAVATGALFVAGATGWLGCAATLPSHRGRGAQGVILAERIARARELGVTELVTETGVSREQSPGPSYRNILRSGFEPAYVRPNYLPA